MGRPKPLINYRGILDGENSMINFVCIRPIQEKIIIIRFALTLENLKQAKLTSIDLSF